MDIRAFFNGAPKEKAAAGVVPKHPRLAASATSNRPPPKGERPPKKQAVVADNEHESHAGAEDAKARWSWMFGTRWKSFGADEQVLLNAGWRKYSKGESDTIQLEIKQGDKAVKYRIDFSTMEQFNVDTDNVRRIKRVLGEPKTKAEAVAAVEPTRSPSSLDSFRAQSVQQERIDQAAKRQSKKTKTGPVATVTTYTKADAKPEKPGKPAAKKGGGGGWWGAKAPPPLQGLKAIPKGKPNCFAGLSFLITGTLESIDRDDAFELVKKYGGTIIKSVPKKKKLDYAIVGEEAGEKKLLELEKLGTPQLDENGLLELIRNSLPEDERALQPEVGTLIEKQLVQNGRSGGVTGAASAAASAPALVPTEPRDTLHDLWTDKYKPQSVNDLVGNIHNAQKVIDWIERYKPTKGSGHRAVLLSGPPGIGKTSMSHVILKGAGFEVKEFNASDVRSKKAVAGQVEDITTSRSMGEFFASAGQQAKKLALIMDEVDGMSSGDRGGIQELIRIIEKSQVPIVCCCNDDTSDKVRALKKHCLNVPLTMPHITHVKKRILEIAAKENMSISEEAVDKLYQGCNGDLRQMITSLQMWRSTSSSMSEQDVKHGLESQHKEILQVTVHDVAKKIMSQPLDISQRMEAFFLNTDMAPLFVQQMYPSVAMGINCSNKQELARRMAYTAKAADAISDSDLVQESIRGRGNWSLLPLYGLTSSAIPGFITGSWAQTTASPQFPLALGQMSKGNKRARLLRELSMHTARSISGGAIGLRLDYFEPLRRHLTAPLQQSGSHAVPQVIQALDDLGMSKDDWDTLTGEFGLGNAKDLHLKIDGKVRSAFTREYNKSHKETQRIKRSAQERTVRGGADSADESEDDDDVSVFKGAKAKGGKRKPGQSKGGSKGKKTAKKKR